MRTQNDLPSVCRHCRHYSPQGRRGGMCQKLNAPVQGNWQACSLANYPFLLTWEMLETITLWDNPSFQERKIANPTNTHSEVKLELEADTEKASQTTFTV